MTDYGLIQNLKARYWIFQSQIGRGLRLGIYSSEQLFSLFALYNHWWGKAGVKGAHHIHA